MGRGEDSGGAVGAACWVHTVIPSSVLSEEIRLGCQAGLDLNLHRAVKCNTRPLGVGSSGTVQVVILTHQAQTEWAFSEGL